MVGIKWVNECDYLAHTRWAVDVRFLLLCPSARFTKMSRWWWLRINTPRLVTTGWSYHGPPFPVWRLWPENTLSSSDTCTLWGKKWLQTSLGLANSASDWATMPFPAWGKPCGECWCVLVLSRWTDGFSLGPLTVLTALRSRGVGWGVSKAGGLKLQPSCLTCS